MHKKWKSYHSRVCPFSPKNLDSRKSEKKRFCHFWPSEAFVAFVSLLIRVSQFFQVSPTVPLLGRVFHPYSRNGLFSALRRILNLHSVPDSKSVFWPFLALWALDHFFSLATWQYKQHTSFGSRSFIPKLLRPAFSFESPEKRPNFEPTVQVDWLS